MRDGETVRRCLNHSFRLALARLVLPGSKEAVDTSMVLTDFSALGTSIFSDREIKKGGHLSLQLLEPSLATIPCVVLACRKLPSPSLVYKKESRQRYRLLLEFRLHTEEEKKAVQEIQKSIHGDSANEAKDNKPTDNKPAVERKAA